jgi:L-asparaginase II
VSRALTEAPVLAHVVRGGFVESVHRACAVVTDPSGGIERAWGDPSGLVFPRSANKPLQAVGMVEAGLSLPPALLALVCSSHSGEARHQDAARAILASAGLTEADLRNTPDYPVEERERETWLRADRPATSLAQNCSGKHAGMLATTVANGWSAPDYLDPDHPLQRAITAAISRLACAGAPVGAIAVDGCGAPLHGIPLHGLAHGFGTLAAAAAGTPEAVVGEAMRAHPEMVGGARRQVTILMEQVPGLVAKDGAESVYAVGLPDGRGVAVKVVDGHTRAKSVVLAAILRSLGVGTDHAYAALEDVPVLGHGRPVGAVVAAGL